MELNTQTPSTLYTEMEELQKDIISIHSSIVSVANQLWFWLPMLEESDWCAVVQANQTTVRNTIKNIKELVCLTKDRANNLEDNVK